MAISFKGAHFPPEIILMGVRWYVAYPLSTRHVVAYLGAADILLRPLPCRLSDTYQPVISPQNRFSTPHPRLLA